MAKIALNGTKSVARNVREVLAKRPFLVNALMQNIVNYSALARYIQKDLRNASVEAIKTALIREKENLRREISLNEERILKLLKNSRIELRDKVAVIITNRTLNIQYIASSVVTGLTKHNVYIADQTELKKVYDAKITKNLVALTIKSPTDIENVSGFVAFLTQLLASNGINIREFISCYTDTVIVLTKNEGLKTFNLLQKYV
jgi:hypothetical protein